nr:uncharacterized protein LOC105850534 [Hydra vulgaris]
MANSKSLFWYFFLIGCQIVMTEYFYPAKKSLTRDSYTLYKGRKVENSIFSTKIYTEYKECVNFCHNNKETCKSIDTEIVDNNTVKCRFFNEQFPKTIFADGFTYISSKPPNCSLSCDLTQSPCGKCKCNPSCATRNRRQYICNCTLAAEIAKSCQEHYNNGFTITAVYRINPNGFIFKTVCEMNKLEQKKLKVDYQLCMHQSSSIIQFSFTLSISYCVITCANNSNFDTVVFDISCFCAKYIKEEIECGEPQCSKYDYCKINASSASCTILKESANQFIIYDKKVPVYFNSSLCTSFCINYHKKMPSYNGYVASGIVTTDNDCLCLYGFTGKTVAGYYGCSYFETSPMTIAPTIIVSLPPVVSVPLPPVVSDDIQYTYFYAMF